MPHYSEEFKEQVVRKMMAPNAMSVAQVSRDTGVSEQTLYNWRNRFRNEGKAVPADPSNPEHCYEMARQCHPERWSGNTRNWDPVTEVWLNPPKENQAEKSQGLKAA